MKDRYLSSGKAVPTGLSAVGGSVGGWIFCGVATAPSSSPQWRELRTQRPRLQMPLHLERNVLSAVRYSSVGRPCVAQAASGGELYVPPGVFLTTGFALTSHMSLFLEAGATILGALPNSSRWRVRNESCSRCAPTSEAPLV